MTLSTWSEAESKRYLLTHLVLPPIADLRPRGRLCWKGGQPYGAKQFDDKNSPCWHCSDQAK
jgi:hypothetical protein